MRNVYITIYTKEHGRLEFTLEEWRRFDRDSISLHKEDGPAIEFSREKHWFFNNRRHRIDGPAVEGYDGISKIWFIDDQILSEECFCEIIQEAKSLPLELKLTDPRWWVREMS